MPLSKSHQHFYEQSGTLAWRVLHSALATKRIRHEVPLQHDSSSSGNIMDRPRRTTWLEDFVESRPSTRGVMGYSH
ncbi:hypothetical protein E4U55_005565 [Claviceps digitariae]|nr:hypothetical protein E4U55_005565 [Claviceps digitariae]